MRKNQLSARKTTLSRQAIGIQRTKKICLYHVWNEFNRANESRLALALKYVFPHLIRNILFCYYITWKKCAYKDVKFGVVYSPKEIKLDNETIKIKNVSKLFKFNV